MRLISRCVFSTTWLRMFRVMSSAFYLTKHVSNFYVASRVKGTGMKIQGNKEYGQHSLQQVEADAKYSAASSLNSALSPNTERRTPNVSPQSSLLSPLNSVLSPNTERRMPNVSPQSSPLGPHHLFTDVCVGLLNQGKSVRFKANGWSMHPTICDGEMIHVEPVLPSQVRHGDIILYGSPRGITAHRVVHIQKEINSALSPQPSVKLSGHWVIRLLGHFWVSLSPNSQRRTPN